MQNCALNPSHLPQSEILPKPRETKTLVSFFAIQSALRKAIKNLPLSFEDGVNLYHSPDLLELGMVADEINVSKNGHDVFFNVNRHINPTNICALSCKFCAFSRKPGDAGAYVFSLEEIAQKALQAQESGATEIHMVGGLHPRWSLKNYVEIIQTVKENAPLLHLKAFTAVEIDWLSRRERMPSKAILETLRNAGLDSLPGGGAEIFEDRVRSLICDTKLTGEGWINIHKEAHSLKMRSNCTMLYGHIEDVESRIDHMIKLRTLQEETHGFNVFIPLAFQPDNNALGIKKHTYGVDDLKTIAISRLVLNNFKNIKSYWVMTGDLIAQTALNFGANDLDGTIVEEKIANMAGSKSGMVRTKSSMIAMIREAKKIPVERNTIYEAIRRFE